MERLRIHQVSIQKLFGIFNHVINLRQDDNITIIHGPNGVGKTTILKIVKDLFDRNFHRIQTYPFESIDIKFSEGTWISLSRKTSGEESHLEVAYSIDGDKRNFKIPDLSHEFMRRIPPHIIDDILPFLSRIGPDKWIDKNSNEIMTFSDIFYKYKDELPIRSFSAEKQPKIPDEFIQILISIPVHFIQTQRLFVNPEPQEIRHSPMRKPRHATTIENYSKEMVELILDAVRQSGAVSASLDRTFPNRLLTGQISSEATEKSIREHYKSQNDFRNRLMQAGLIEAEAPVALPERTLGEYDLKVLFYYLHDVDEKFKAYSELLLKIELFKEIISSRFLYKKLQIDKNEGFVFISDVKERIPLKALSSGEQHEIVLAFELIFKVPSNSLILIDEPELSLHVTWQHRLLDDLKKVSNLIHLDFLIATHSPSIVQGKRSLMEIIPNEERNT